MENASKALVMAGGVLIGILLLSLAVYLFADFGATSARVNEQNAQKQIVEFNSRFTAYENYKDENGEWKITIYDIISLATYAKEYNAYNEESGEDKISVNIGIGVEKNLQLKQQQEYQNIIEKYTIDGGITKFKCNNIEYSNNGKVKTITFSTTE